jgi:two-component system, OmpR family, sensor histidine kinase BaeS
VARGLLWKLFGINILLIGFVIIAVWIAIDFLAAAYFVTLMEKYHIDPRASHGMFVDSIHRYLMWATVSALSLAAVLSFVLVRRVLAPLTAMTRSAGVIASGDYSDRVPVTSRDEVGQLAVAFNRMAESLDDMEQLRRRLMIDVAHELRTPLTNLRGYLEALRDGVVPPTEDTFELLHEEALRLGRLAEDILKLARADAARSTIRLTETDLIGLIRHTVDAFRQRFQSKGIAIETRFDDPVPLVRVDPAKLSQVISNLLENAVQYTNTDGAVRISAFRENGRLKVEIANTGGEISTADLPFLFERLYRGEKSRSRHLGGAGIGLAIVKELIRAHDGTVSAEIRGPETVVGFSLPVR